MNSQSSSQRSHPQVPILGWRACAQSPQGGRRVDADPESGNPHGLEAIAIYVENDKFGNIPADRNSMIAAMLFFGHADIFETPEASHASLTLGLTLKL